MFLPIFCFAAVQNLHFAVEYSLLKFWKDSFCSYKHGDCAIFVSGILFFVVNISAVFFKGFAPANPFLCDFKETEKIFVIIKVAFYLKFF